MDDLTLKEENKKGRLNVPAKTVVKRSHIILCLHFVVRFVSSLNNLFYPLSVSCLTSGFQSLSKKIAP